MKQHDAIKKTTMKRATSITAAALAVSAIYFFWTKWNRRHKTYKIDQQFTGAYPRGTGAFNSVIGGHPEDMNGMPARVDRQEGESPIYDGSSLSAPTADA